MTAKEAPSIRDVQLHDLQDTGRLMDLYRQACDVGLAKGGDAGRLDFLSFAHRARVRATKPGAMLIWLLREDKRAFITLADEEAAARTVREHHDGPSTRRASGGGIPGPSRGVRDTRQLTDDERTVELCLREAKRLKGWDGFCLAQHVKGWTREQWDQAEASYIRKHAQHWEPPQDW